MSMIGAWQSAGPAAGIGAALVVLLAAAGSVVIAIVTGAARPRLVNGPLRLPPDRPAWVLGVVLFASFSVYLLAISTYLDFHHPGAEHSAATQPVTTAADDAFLSTGPPIIALAALLAGDYAVRQRVRPSLGIDPRGIGSGVVRGLLGAVVIIPPLYLIAFIVELAYQAIHYAHPAEHPLLKALGERPGGGVMAAIVLGACVVAPVFEEVFFRAHLQTLVRQAFYRLGTPRPPARGFEVIGPDALAPDPPPEPPSPPHAWQTWAGVLVTSALFAALHPAWSAPIIFALSLCLGYAYERTGNIWVPVTMHAAFNTVSTAVFLAGLGSR